MVRSTRHFFRPNPNDTNTRVSAEWGPLLSAELTATVSHSVVDPSATSLMYLKSLLTLEVRLVSTVKERVPLAMSTGTMVSV